MKAEISLKLERCKGCGICVNFCPKKVLEIDKLGKVTVTNPEACIGCGQCELRCPDYAIFVDKIKEGATK
ncbi:MAG: 4Fe-4S binding protein [Selenomonadaceae bacterium]|nr:4Fe-4S binding protein [Selenomonadaceae bacterium]